MDPQPSWRKNSVIQKLVAAGAVLVIIASGVWIYQTQFASPEINVPLHQSVGCAMAEETVKRVGHIGKVVVVTMDPRRSPELRIQVTAFQKSLKSLGNISIKDTIVLDPGENPKYRPGSGLSAKRFLKIARKNPGVDAIVSFVGAPQLSDQELAQLKSAPKLIAETHSPERLLNLFEKSILQTAIVPRYEFPAPGPRKPETNRQWFDRYFQIVAADTKLPKVDESP